jgi:4-amino-4-deoxy-L-arabinose transferase-like glycosyltransferase
VSAERGPHGALKQPLSSLRAIYRPLLLLAGLALVTALLRLPTFFEPPWHTDEGIFQAVAQKVAHGGDLYADAWESKPPLFLYIYVVSLQLFGPGVLSIKIAAAVAAFATEAGVFGIAKRYLSTRASLAAAVLAGVLLAVPFWEGNLAVTETFALPPTVLAVLCLLCWEKRPGARGGAAWLLATGVLFGLAFLIRQTTALIAVGAIVWLLASGREWRQPLLLIAGGTVAAIVPVVAVFAVQHDFYWFWDANVAFFVKYVPSGRELPLYYRPLTLAPIVMAVLATAVHARRGERPSWTLPLLWLTITLATSMVTGRPYPHYLLQCMPPLALLLVMLAPHAGSWRFARRQWPALGTAGALVALWLLVVTPEFSGNLAAMRYSHNPDYYVNFARYAMGLQSRSEYNDYFDDRVNLTERLEQELGHLAKDGDVIYIWGEYPWVYPLSDTTPATPYMTSFYVLLMPHLDTQLRERLNQTEPRFIVMLNDAWPSVPDYQGVLKRRWDNATRALNGLIAERYEQAAVVGRARVFRRTAPRTVVTWYNRPAAEDMVVDEDTPMATR